MTVSIDTKLLYCLRIRDSLLHQLRPHLFGRLVDICPQILLFSPSSALICVMIVVSSNSHARRNLPPSYQGRPTNSPTYDGSFIWKCANVIPAPTDIHHAGCQCERKRTLTTIVPSHFAQPFHCVSELILISKAPH
jgi:hypothetical protein